jgi:hypothetical protein
MQAMPDQTTTDTDDTDPNRPTVYELKLRGHLGNEWTDWFEGATIALQDDGETVLTCSVSDQAALHGLLRKVRDLGMPLLSVTRIQPSALNQVREGSS